MLEALKAPRQASAGFICRSLEPLALPSWLWWRHEVPCHHSLRKYLEAWIEAAGIGGDKKGWLFRSIRKGNHLTTNRMDTNDVLRMIKRRAKAASLPYSTCCHTFRATGITTYLKNGGTLEHAQQIAAHESPRTTKLYDRTSDQVSVNEIERIEI